MSIDESSILTEEFIKNGTALFGMGMYDELAQICREFLKTDKNDQVYSMLASAEFSLGETQAAEESVRKGLEINPSNPDLLYNLACILQNKNLISNAVRYFARAEKACTSEEYKDLPDYIELAGLCRSEINRLIKILEKNENEIIPQKAEKRVLIVAAVYPPLSGSGIQRTAKLVKFLRLYGWEPVVITPATKTDTVFSDGKYFDELPDDIEVLRIPQKKSAAASDVDYMMSKVSQMLSEPMAKQLEYYYDKLDIEKRFALCSFPESLVFWAAQIADNLNKYLDVSTIDAVYSTSGPYSDHVAGYYIKKLYNIPWVADFRDEWSKNPFIWPDKEYIHYRMCVDCEQTIFKFADHIVFVTERSCENGIELGLPGEKVSCITNGYDEEDFEWFENNSVRNEKFTIVHNGLTYAGRTTITIAEALKNLIDKGEIDRNKIILHMGHSSGESEKEDLDKAIKSFGLENIAIHNPYMDHHDSIVHTSTADLLLLLLGESDEYSATYPGKIFEYLRFNKPILSLGPHGSISENLLQRTGHGVNVNYNDIAGIEKEILRFYNMWEKQSDGISSAILTKEKTFDISVYERRHLASKHAGIFDKISENI